MRDTGVGLDEEALAALRRSLDTDEGRGFGLLASYRRLRLMYGDDLDFRIDSAENQGTVITIRFPRRTEETP